MAQLPRNNTPIVNIKSVCYTSSIRFFIGYMTQHTTYKILTVAEDEYASNRLTAEFNSDDGWTYARLRLSVDANRKLTIGIGDRVININKIDVDDFIEYFQEVKNFLSEEDLVKTLMGQKK